MLFELKDLSGGDFGFETWSHIAQARLELVVDAGLESFSLRSLLLRWVELQFSITADLYEIYEINSGLHVCEACVLSEEPLFGKLFR